MLAIETRSLTHINQLISGHVALCLGKWQGTIKIADDQVWWHFFSNRLMATADL